MLHRTMEILADQLAITASLFGLMAAVFIAFALLGGYGILLSALISYLAWAVFRHRHIFWFAICVAINLPVLSLMLTFTSAL